MKEPVEEISVTRAVLMILAGPILWAGHFAFAYATHTLACASVVSASAVPWAIGMATLLAVMMLALMMRKALRLGRSERATANSRFLSRVSRVLAVLSLTGVLWTGWATVALETCARLR